jgi:two-component sensor histidine kinase
MPTRCGPPAERELAAGVVDTVREPLLLLDPDLRVWRASRSFYRAFRLTRAEAEGRPLYELGDGQWDVPALRRLLGDVLARDTAPADVEVTHGFATPGERTLRLSARRLAGLDLILLAIEDVTERRRAEAQRELLRAEADHRVKNLLTLVQALAAQTVAHSRSLAEFGAAFEGRLQALARAHGHLLEERGRGADLRVLVERALEAYRLADPATVEARGERLVLPPQRGLALGLILHELATNAAKYGALSAPAGRVEVAWRVEARGGRRWVELCWTERGGPPVEPPTRRGFGTELIERSCAYELGGEARLRFAPEGLRCGVTFPLP